MSHVHHSQRAPGGAIATPKFDQLDTNHNGKISTRELHQAGRQAVSTFSPADKNGDGKITRREFKAFQAAQRQSGRGVDQVARAESDYRPSGGGDKVAESMDDYMNPNAGITREQYEAQRAAARQRQAFEMLMANPNMEGADRLMSLLTPDQRAQVEAARSGQSAAQPLPTGGSISDQQRALFELMQSMQRENQAYQTLKANPNMPAEEAAKLMPLLNPEHRAEIEQLRSAAQNQASNPLQAFQAAIQQVLNLVQSLLRLMNLF